VAISIVWFLAVALTHEPGDKMGSLVPSYRIVFKNRARRRGGGDGGVHFVRRGDDDEGNEAI
jgi:hypothetical protein